MALQPRTLTHPTCTWVCPVSGLVVGHGWSQLTATRDLTRPWTGTHCRSLEYRTTMMWDLLWVALPLCALQSDTLRCLALLGVIVQWVNQPFSNCSSQPQRYHHHHMAALQCGPGPPKILVGCMGHNGTVYLAPTNNWPVCWLIFMKMDN